MKTKRILVYLLCAALALTLLPAKVFAIETYDLTINYEYTDGTEAAPPFEATLDAGTPYSVTSPAIPYYAPSQATVSGNLESDVTVTVVYTIKTHTIIYTVDNQFYRAFTDVACNTPLTELAEPTDTDARFSGWSWNTADGEMPTVMPDTDLIARGTFSYKWTIRFVDAADSTSEVRDSVSYYVPYNTTMMASLGSMNVPGYTLVPVQPGVDPILGTVHLLTPMTSAGHTTIINYDINQYDLTIHYQYDDGTEAAPTHTETLNYNTAYSVTSPAIQNYMPSQATISGNLESDTVVTVIYTRSVSMYVSRILTDTATGITVAGSAINEDAVLTVKASAQDVENIRVACTEIRSRMSEAGTLMLFCGDISLSNGYIGPLNISIPVGEQYNGLLVTIVHYSNGSVETFTVTVVDGKASFTVTTLSPFAAFMPVIAGIPQTGDHTNSALGACLAIFGMIGMGVVLIRKNRKRS